MGMLSRAPRMRRGSIGGGEGASWELLALEDDEVDLAGECGGGEVEMRDRAVEATLAPDSAIPEMWIEIGQGRGWTDPRDDGDVM